MSMIQRLREISPEGEATHIIQFKGIPTDAVQIGAAQYVLEHLLFTDPYVPEGGNADEEIVSSNVEQFFSLPYDQGGGWTLIEFTHMPTLDQYSEVEGAVTPAPKGFLFAGVIATYGYADSMTNIFEANVWTNGKEFLTDSM